MDEKSSDEEVIMGKNDVTVEWPNHNNIFVENIWNVFSNQSLFDFELDCGDKVMGAHALVMLAFCKLLPINGTTTPTPAVTNIKLNTPSQIKFKLDGASEELCQCFLEFLYRGKANLPKDQVKSFLALLQQVGVRGLRELDVHGFSYNIDEIVLLQSQEDFNTNVTDNATTIDELVYDTQNVCEEDAITKAEAVDVINEFPSCLTNIDIDCDVADVAEDVAPLENLNEVCLDVLDNLIKIIEDDQSKTSDSDKLEDSETIDVLPEHIGNMPTCDEQVLNTIIINEYNPAIDNLPLTVDDNRLVISKASHNCECQFDICCEGDRRFCTVDNALRHCCCRFNRQEALTVTFPEFKSQLVDTEEENNCCSQITDSSFLSVKLKSKEHKETTNWFLDSYVSRVMDLSLSFDSPADDSVQDSELRKLLNKPLTEPRNLRSNVTAKRKFQEGIFDKWCNLTRDHGMKRISILGSVKHFPGISEKLMNNGLTNPMDDDSRYFCKMCDYEVSGMASLGLHMVTDHQLVTVQKKKCEDDAEKGDRSRKLLVCSYCSFQAHSERLLAFHLTDVHKDMAVTPNAECSRQLIEFHHKTRQRACKSESYTAMDSETFLENDDSGSTKDSLENDQSPNNCTDSMDDENEEQDNLVNDKNFRVRGVKKDGKDKETKQLRSRRVSNRIVGTGQSKQTTSVNTRAAKKPGTPSPVKSPVKKPVEAQTESFVCNKCGFKTPSRFALKCHALEHVFKPPYGCGTCRRKFNGKSSLMMHIMSHCQPQDFFSCTRCHYVTPWKARFDKHLEKQHNIKVKFVCHICDLEFAHQNSCDGHIRRKHYVNNACKKKNFKCPKCMFMADDAKLLYTHVFEKHINCT